MCCSGPPLGLTQACIGPARCHSDEALAAYPFKSVLGGRKWLRAALWFSLRLCGFPAFLLPVAGTARGGVAGVWAWGGHRPSWRSYCGLEVFLGSQHSSGVPADHGVAAGSAHSPRWLN
eukprot:XP_024997445.1 uncharacterized protein LOC112530017 isoform X2 [Gallus gallus]